MFHLLFHPGAGAPLAYPSNLAAFWVALSVCTSEWSGIPKHVPVRVGEGVSVSCCQTRLSRASPEGVERSRRVLEVKRGLLRDVNCGFVDQGYKGKSRNETFIIAKCFVPYDLLRSAGRGSVRVKALS